MTKQAGHSPIADQQISRLDRPIIIQQNGNTTTATIASARPKQCCQRKMLERGRWLDEPTFSFLAIKMIFTDQIKIHRGVWRSQGNANATKTSKPSVSRPSMPTE